MKIYLTGVFALLLLASPLCAQHNNFGIKGGLNLSTIYTKDNSSFDQKTGFHFGIISHIHLADQFAVQPELIFSRQGAKYKFENTTTNLNLDYLNVPIMFQYMFDNGFRLQAGPQFGLLVGAKSESNNNSVDVKEDYKGVDVGFGLGASYVHPPSGFGVDARYIFGLTNINDNGPDSYNRGLQLGVFYLFKHRS